MINGAASDRPPILSDLRTWCIAYQDASQGVVGHLYDAANGVSRPDEWVRIFPAWKLIGGYQVGSQGVGRMLAIVPLEMLVELRSWTGRPSSLLRLSELSEGDFADFAGRILKGVQAAEDIRSGMRMQRSGIVAVPAGMKLPPMPGGRA